MTKQGEIKYNLWTVAGYKEIEIRYVLTPGTHGEEGIGEIFVKGDPERDIDDESMHEIIELCMEDAKKHGLEEDYSAEVVKPDLVLAAEKFDFSIN